jgi:PEGA domain-containing protein
MTKKKQVISGVILGLALGVSAFCYMQGSRTPPSLPQPKEDRQTKSSPKSISPAAVKPESEESGLLNQVETASHSPNQSLNRPEAIDPKGKKYQEQGAVAPSQLPEEPKSLGRQETGTLSVNAQPWAEVWVDGKSWGQTPVELELPPGKHKVALVYEGQKITQTVTIGAGRVEHLTHVW